MFKQIEQDGIKFLSNKCVERDWNRLMERRDALSRAGKKARSNSSSTWDEPKMNIGSTQDEHEMNLGSTQDDPRKGLNLGSTPDNPRKKVNKEIQNFEKPKSLERSLSDLCSELIGHVEPISSFKKAVRELGIKYNQSDIEEAFNLWAASQGGSPLNWPMQAFLRVAPKLIENNGLSEGITPTDSSALTTLLDEIALVSDNDVVFSPHQKPFIAQLLREFTHQELMAAFRDFYSRVDDFDRKFAAKNFCEKGAQFARTIRTSAEQTKQKTEFIERETARMRAEAEKNLADLAAKHAAEEAAENAAFEELTAEFAKEAGMTSGSVEGEIVR